MEEKKLKSLRTIAMMLGVTGSVTMLHSLLLACFSYANPATGYTAVSMFHYLDVKMAIAFGLLEMSIIFSLLSFAIPQILVGSFTGIWTGLMCWDIQRRSAETTYLNMNLGLGMYMFILSAVLFLASGIVFTIIANKQKAFGIDDKKPAIFKKLEVLCSIMLGISIVLISCFELMKH